MYFAPYLFQFPYYVAPMPDFRHQLFYQTYPQKIKKLKPYYSPQNLNKQGVASLSNDKKPLLIILKRFPCG